MDTPVHQQCVLAQKGYKCDVEFRKSYRGALEINQIVTADLGDKQGFAFIPPEDRKSHYLRIREIQNKIPMAAQITDLVASKVFVIERAPGVLLWEMDKVPDIAADLYSFVDSLEAVDLVHADIRPWNIFYDEKTKRIKVIDWGFSFFGWPPHAAVSPHLNERRHVIYQKTPIDRKDAENTLEVLKGKISFESAWNHGPSERDWWPTWAKPPERPKPF